MVDTDDLALWYAINRLIANYWAEVDDNGGSQAHEFYEPEAVYTVGANRFEGADKIRAFYTRQELRITTRHLVSNLRVFRDDEQALSGWQLRPGRGRLWHDDIPEPVSRLPLSGCGHRACGLALSLLQPELARC